jgi:hypothetical protein
VKEEKTNDRVSEETVNSGETSIDEELWQTASHFAKMVGHKMLTYNVTTDLTADKRLKQLKYMPTDYESLTRRPRRLVTRR